MPPESNELEEVHPDPYFLDPTTAPSGNHPALTAASLSDSSSSENPAVRDGQPSSSQIPAAGVPQNQRRHLRFRVEEVSPRMYTKGLLTTIGLGRANIARSAINLSEGGLLLLASDRLKPGTRVHVQIELETVRDALEADGIVRWSGESARNAGRFFVGVQFEKLAHVQISKIRAMRAWFTSKEYKLRSATRRRMKDGGIQPKV